MQSDQPISAYPITRIKSQFTDPASGLVIVEFEMRGGETLRLAFPPKDIAAMYRDCPEAQAVAKPQIARQHTAESIKDTDLVSASIEFAGGQKYDFKMPIRWTGRLWRRLKEIEKEWESLKRPVPLTANSNATVRPVAGIEVVKPDPHSAPSPTKRS